MNKYTKLTLDELIRRKEQMLEAKKTRKKQDIYIRSLDAIITVQEPDTGLCRDAAEMSDGEGDVYMCYESVVEPNLKDKELQEAYGCASPMDIVNMIFAPGEIPQIAIECMKLAGYMGGVETVKN